MYGKKSNQFVVTTAVMTNYFPINNDASPGVHFGFRDRGSIILMKQSNVTSNQSFILYFILSLSYIYTHFYKHIKN